MELRPSTIIKHGILLPHITLGTQNTFTFSDGFVAMLEPELKFIFKVENGKVYIKKTSEPDSFSLLKYDEKHNRVLTSATLAEYFRGKFPNTSGKLIFMLPIAIEGMNLASWTELQIKNGVLRKSRK